MKSEEGRKLAESEMGALKKQNVEKEKLKLEEETLALTEKILSLEQQKSDDEGLLTKTNELKTKSEVELDGLYFFSFSLFAPRPYAYGCINFRKS